MLKAQNRLRKDDEFMWEYPKIRPTYSHFFSLRLGKNGLSHSRFGVVVSTKIEKSAVKRNRLRRQTRSILGKLIPRVTSGQDIVISVSLKARGVSFPELERDLTGLFQKMGLLPPQSS